MAVCCKPRRLRALAADLHPDLCWLGCCWLLQIDTTTLQWYADGDLTTRMPISRHICSFLFLSCLIVERQCCSVCSPVLPANQRAGYIAAICIIRCCYYSPLIIRYQPKHCEAAVATDSPPPDQAPSNQVRGRARGRQHHTCMVHPSPGLTFRMFMRPTPASRAFSPLPAPRCTSMMRRFCYTR